MSKMQRVATSLIGLLTLVVAGAQNASWDLVFHEQFNADASPLYVFGGQLTFGPREDSPYVNTLRDNVLEIKGEDGAAAGLYFYLLPKDVSAWQAAPEVRPAVYAQTWARFGDNGSVGLVWNLEPSTGYFYAAKFTGGQTLSIYKNDPDGFREVVRLWSTAIQQDRLNGLEVVPRDNGWELFVNGTSAGIYFDGDVKGQGLGIIVGGAGQFHFDEFKIFLPTGR